MTSKRKGWVDAQIANNCETVASDSLRWSQAIVYTQVDGLINVGGHVVWEQHRFVAPFNLTMLPNELASSEAKVLS